MGYLSDNKSRADEQVITYAARTPLTKAKKGGLKDTPIDDLLIALLTVLPQNCLSTKPDANAIADCPRAIESRPQPR